ncbi:UvrD-helicase domain-containing protein [Candidatus Methylacidiphilum infernorum]|uniref:DNA 3'-5' helicase n=1 Tax=Methylacidiphilum infernorum (isolate V4) TaxID=481448 RepID=B3E192_METI4|nr:UvrD-helicase domain-containing protein [Candidatus Methylacidiphilum infernorum]ACD82888.1 ATP-dependent exoDNAse (exonuclease V) beta subunit (contains helicase and exonuclease domains) [Methylacidiphilum infernorum V4]
MIIGQPKETRRLVVVASAGAGKTHQLVERALDLLLEGVAPHSLLIITFTRKASQEIVDRIFSTLAQRVLASKEKVDPSPEESLLKSRAYRCLQTLIEDLPFLRFGTIDSFLYHLLRYIPPDKKPTFAPFSLLDDKGKKSLQQEIVRRILTAREFESPFLDSFEMFYWGEDYKVVFPLYLAVVEKYYPFFPDFPSTDFWGEPGSFQKEEELTKEAGFLTLLERIESLLKTAGIPTKTWEEQKLKISSFPRLYRNLLEAYDPQTGRCPQIRLERKRYDLNEELASSLGMLAQKTIDFFIEKSHRRTKAVAQLLSFYDLLYRKTVERQAICSFEDIPRIILQAVDLNCPQPFLYKLDRKWDHLLIDEFQDTSLLQWKVIKLFVDEIIQHEDGSRSFFCVGDPKQSIYGWRGAYSGLIDSLEVEYRMEKRQLSGSRRSSKAVLELVNRLLGNFEKIGKLLPESLERWKKRWVYQEARDEELEGYGCFLCVQLPQGEAKGDSPEEGNNGEEKETGGSLLRYEAIKKLLVDEIKPHQRALSCAVLVQTNKEAEAIFQYLSLCSALRVSLEGKIYPGKDNLMAKLFFALVQSLAHPADSLALGWLQASPIGSIFKDEQWRKEFWRVFSLAGFEALAFRFLAALKENSPGEDFQNERMEMILQICRSFDNTGSRDCDQFLNYYKNYSLPLSEDPSSVQVRTVHSAKGLEFDVVLVTELAGSRNTAMNQLRELPVAYKSSSRDWKLFFLPRREVAEKVPRLSCLYKELLAEEELEKLSLLYVAMTRARQGLYLLGEVREKKSKPSTQKKLVYWQDLLFEVLGRGEDTSRWFFPDFPLLTVFETGKRRWTPRPRNELFRREKYKAMESQDLLFPPRALSRTSFVSPSSVGVQAAELDLFSRVKEKGLDYGLLVHKILAQVERFSEAIKEKLEKRALEYAKGDEEKNPFKEVLECLQSAAIKPIFSPEEGTKVWIERSFCVELDGRWLRGTFDRVHIKEDPTGELMCTLYDFKTDFVTEDRKEELAQKYRLQLEYYQKALCRLLGIPAWRVKVFIVSLSLKELIAL